jgi:hypothetical protein
MAQDFALAKYTNEKIAELLSISIGTFYKWVNQYPSFEKALKKGREIAVSRVARGIYESATGYSHEDEVVKITEEGSVYRAKTKKHYPPSIAAASFFIRNHSPNWNEKTQQELSGPGGEPLAPLTIQITVGERPQPKEARVVDVAPADQRQVQVAAPVAEPAPGADAAQPVATPVEAAESPQPKQDAAAEAERAAEQLAGMFGTT